MIKIMFYILIIFLIVGCKPKIEESFTINVVKSDIPYNISTYKDYACKQYMINETNEVEICANYPKDAINNTKLCSLPLKEEEESNSLVRLCLKDCRIINECYLCVGQFEKCILY